MSNIRTEQSVKNGIKIIKTAIRRKISLSEASRQANYGRNYVSDIKLRLRENYRSKNVTKESYSEFNTLMKEYMR
jgi:hypothetical protein